SRAARRRWRRMPRNIQLRFGAATFALIRPVSMIEPQPTTYARQTADGNRLAPSTQAGDVVVQTTTRMRRLGRRIRVVQTCPRTPHRRTRLSIDRYSSCFREPPPPVMPEARM